VFLVKVENQSCYLSLGISHEKALDSVLNARRDRRVAGARIGAESDDDAA
jgi:hypothetical protein